MIDLFEEPLHGLPPPLSPPSESSRFSVSGRIPFMAAMAASASDLAGLSVHALMMGMIPILILLEMALALELASVPVAIIEVGGAVMEMG